MTPEKKSHRSGRNFEPDAPLTVGILLKYVNYDRSQRLMPCPVDQEVLQHGTLDALVESMAQAYLEVRKLLARDTWPRFRSSRHFPAYQAMQKALLEQEERMAAT